MRLGFLLLFVISFSTYSQVWQKDLIRFVDSLQNNYLRSGDSDIYSDSLENAINCFISDIPNDFNPLDSLKNKFGIVWSNDSSVFCLNYEIMFGGNWHNFRSILFHKKKNGSYDIHKLYEQHSYAYSGFNDCVIRKIAKKDNFILVMGWGTHGSGMEHQLLKLFKTDSGFSEIISPISNHFQMELEYPRAYHGKEVFILDDDWNLKIAEYIISENSAPFGNFTGNYFMFKFKEGEFTLTTP